MAFNDHPSLNLQVTEAERDRAENLLKDAYVDGRIDMVELDRRVGRVMTATTRRDLNACLEGLPTPPRPVAPFVSHVPATTTPTGTGAAALAHFLPFVSWVFGPLAVWAVSAPRSYARREAAKAFNWTFTATVVMVVLGIVGAILDVGLVNMVVGLWPFVWAALTVVGGAKAAQGADWTNPVTRVLRWNILDPSGR